MIDWERANELREEVGAEDFEEVFEMFLAEVEEVMVKLIAAPDLSTMEDDLHFLKGSALSLGFAHFSNLCQIGETAAANGQASEIDMDKIYESYAASKTEFWANPDKLAA